MKKISVTSQIILLFFIVVLISLSTFSLFSLTRVRLFAEDETYTRLIAYSKLFETYPSLEEVKDYRDMEVGFVKKTHRGFIYSNDIVEFLTESEIEKLVIEIHKNQTKENLVLTEKFINKNNELIYYVYSTSDGGETFSLTMTNASYVSNLVGRLSIQMILVFTLVTAMSIFVIATWSVKFVNRIHKIQDQILTLQNEDEPRVVDNSADEIGELSRSIEDMRKQILESEHIKREMLQNISHDFKTPIAVIKSYAEAQQDGMVDEESSKIIITQAEILKNKVNRLLQYNSLEYLSKEKEFEDVNMKEVIEEVIRGYKFQTNLEIDLDLNEEIYFKGYRENYYTIVDNIVDNSKRYAKTKIKIVLRKDRLRIYNDGEHIDEQFLNGIFKPYEKGSKGEFGLGMSIVKKTVDFFGMQLKVKNEPIGVSFIITK